MSASLYPIKLFEEIFSTSQYRPQSIIVSGMLESDEKRLFLALDIGLSTSFRKRKTEVLEEYAKLILFLSKKLKESILAFTPSKEYAKALKGFLQEATIINGAEKNTYGEADCKESIFISYMRGALAEGVELDLGGCSPRVLIIVGLPYPKIDEKTHLVLSSLSKAYGLEDTEFYEAYLYSSMISALVQASGRVGRREKGVVVIVDNRFPLLKIPNVKVVKNIYTLINTIYRYLGE